MVAWVAGNHVQMCVCSGQGPGTRGRSAYEACLVMGGWEVLGGNKVMGVMVCKSE